MQKSLAPVLQFNMAFNLCILLFFIL